MGEQHLTRKQRRLASSAPEPKVHVTEIPLAQPDRSGPKDKTLFDLAAEREAELHQQVLARQQGRQKANPAAGEEEEEAVVTALTYGASLSMVHYTFEVLVQHQYAQEVDWWAPARRLWLVCPIICVMIYVMHAKTIVGLPLLRQLAFLATSVVTGCYGIWLGNGASYYAVMKNFPPIAVLCIWSIVEMKLLYTLVFLAVVAVYAWWHGYMPY